MEAGESSETSRSVRKRTESNGGSSDSDLSDGWNFVDKVEVSNHDLASSDGESIEVLDNDSCDNGGEREDENTEPVVEGETHLLIRPKVPVVPTVQQQPPALAQQLPALPAGQEEMFDLSFRWFLFFAVSAVLASNFAILAADYVMDWNLNKETYEKVPSPSFLRDLPVTPKIPQSNKYSSEIPWSNSEEVVVETVDEVEVHVKVAEKSTERNQEKNPGGKSQKTTLRIFNHEIEKYFNNLSLVTGSTEAQNKFAQTLLILDALHVGLNDLEQVVPHSSDLQEVVKSQKTKLTEALAEIEFGVARFMEKISSIVLNKVQKLEKSFEDQWCRLEKKGYKEELNGIFYDCYESENIYYNNINDHKNKYDGKDSKNKKVLEENDVDKSRKVDAKNYKNNDDEHSSENNKNYKNTNGQNEQNQFQPVKDLKRNNYEKERFEKASKEEEIKIYKKPDQYEIRSKEDKVHNNVEYVKAFTENIIRKENSKHYDDYESQKKYNHKPEYKSSGNHEKGEQQKFNKNDKSEKYEKHSGNEKSSEQDNRKDKKPNSFNEGKYSFKEPDNDRKLYETKKGNKATNDNHENKHQNNFIKVAADKVSSYFKEKCDRNKKITSELYKKMKDSIKDNIKVPVEMFNNLFNKYCAPSKDNFKKDKYEGRENNYKNKKGGKVFERKDFNKETPNVIDSQDIKNVMEFKIIESSEENELPFTNNRNKIIEPTNKPRQWTFNYEESLHNKTDVDGEWFIKAGESRSKTRWSHHRGDWWFDRASHRRSGPHSIPTPRNWFAGRRKNWFFRRAWARQQCRQSPHDEWCYLNSDDHFTVPNRAPNF